MKLIKKTFILLFFATMKTYYFLPQRKLDRKFLFIKVI